VASAWLALASPAGAGWPRAGRAVGRAVDRFFAPQPYAALVVCRVVFGAIAFGYFAGRAGLVQEIWGPEGLFGVGFLERMAIDVPARAREGAFDWLAHNRSAALVWALWAIGAGASALFALGAFTRPAGAVALIVYTLFHARNPYATAGWSVMLKPFLLYVLLAPTGRFGSVDAWRRGDREALAAPAAWRGPGWPVRLLQVHGCTMFLVAGWSRIDNPSWWSGEATFAAVSDLFYARFDLDWQPWKGPLAAATFAALALEGLAPVALWIPRVGPLWALALLALHAGLEIVDNHGSWQLLMGAAVLTFLPAPWLARLAPRRGRTERLRPAPRS
jgi:hypothetical protein